MALQPHLISVLAYSLPIKTHISASNFTKNSLLQMASSQGQKIINVQSFPRPPLLEKTPRHLQIRWNGELIADTRDAYWVLETHHPPSTYI